MAFKGIYVTVYANVSDLLLKFFKLLAALTSNLRFLLTFDVSQSLKTTL